MKKKLISRGLQSNKYGNSEATKTVYKP